MRRCLRAASTSAALARSEYESVLRRLTTMGLHRRDSPVGAPSESSLAKLERALQRLGRPTDRLAGKTIHVVGTNGKGSVAWKTSAGLQFHGASSDDTKLEPGRVPSPIRVGLYTSPHVFSVRERIRLGGAPISVADFTRLGRLVVETVGEEEGLSYFECVTLMAFLYFDEARVDYAVVEAGMGGRGDATNVLVAPRVACLTTVALEHVQVLGSSVEEICREKVGVFKKNALVVLGSSVSQECRVIARETAARVGARMAEPGPTPSAGGGVNEENTSTAYQILSCILPPSKLQDPGLLSLVETTLPPYRFDVHASATAPGVVVLDVAHNPSALRRLTREFLERFSGKKNRRLVIVLALARDKDVESCVRAVLEGSECRAELKLTTSGRTSARPGADPAALRALASSYLEERGETTPVTTHEDVATALDSVLTRRDDEEIAVLVCGTHAILKDAQLALRRAGWASTGHADALEPDPFDTNETGAKPLDPSLKN